MKNKTIPLFLFSFLLSALIFCGAPLDSAGFPNEKDIDNEYETDMFMSYFLPEWNFGYHFVETGLRVTSGSMDIKRLYIQEELKTRFTLIEDTFWVRFGHKRIETIDFSDYGDEIEFEYSPCKNVFLSQPGTVAFKKYDSDIGWAVRYATGESNGVKLTYILTDFDNNYAFHNRSTQEDFEKFYGKYPRQWRLELKRNIKGLKFYSEAVYNTGYMFRYTDLINSAGNYKESGESFNINTNIYADVLSSVSAGFDFSIIKNREVKTLYQPAAPGSFSDNEKKYYLRPYIEKRLETGLKLFAGYNFVSQNYEIDYPSAASSDFDYEKTNNGGFLLFLIPVKKKIYLETGYIGDYVKWEKNSSPAVSGKKMENRLKLACGFDFSEKAKLKLVTGWDLDSQDWGKFAIFDGGHVQLQVLF